MLTGLARTRRVAPTTSGSRLATILTTAAVGLAVVAAGWPSTAGATVGLPVGCDLAAQTVTCTYGYTGASARFNVPAGITKVHVKAVGAPGAGNGKGAAGGFGAVVQGDLSVTPSTALYPVVGGAGGCDIAPRTLYCGGYNGGGGGAFGNCDANGCVGDGGGGGASDLRSVDGDASTRLIVAGGGGGAGATGDSTGGGGGNAMASGAPGGTIALVGQGGAGGGAATAVAGGAGGAGGTPVGLFGVSGCSGSAGVFVNGGDGGAVFGPLKSCAVNGGGGGGGLYGGGGGGAGAGRGDFSSVAGGGGGGGGSNLVPANGSQAVDATGVPQVVISYSLPSVTITSPFPPSGKVGQAYSSTYTATGDTGITFAVTGGALPGGLILNNNGSLSGTPTTAGSFTYTVTATGDTGAQATRQDTIVIGSAATASAAGVDFGSATVGTSVIKTVTLSASGGTVNVSGVSISGANAGDFSKSADHCTGIAVTSSCTVDVTFSPSAAGARSATITFADDAAGGSQAAALTGTGVVAAPAVSVSPSSVDFGNQGQGTTSAQRTVTVTNTGTASLHITTVAIGGTNAGDFAKAADACAGVTVAPGANCTIKVTFTPSATGARAASLNITDDAADSPQHVPLSGTGVAVADLKVSASATPNPVKSGATITYTVTLTNNGPQAASAPQLADVLPGGVQFQTLAAPAGWSCTSPAIGSTGQITCGAASLPSGATVTFTIKAKVVAKAKTTLNDTTTVSASTSDPVTGNNTATVTTSVQGGNP